MTNLAKPVNTESDRERLKLLGQLCWDSHRDAVPIREAFLQIRAPKVRPGILGDLVRRGDEHALDLYLLLRIPLSAPPFQLEVDPDYWGLLARRPAQSRRNARLAIYRSLDRLESLALLRRDTRGSRSRVVLLDESGNGDLYVIPPRATSDISSSHTATGSSALIAD